MATQQQVDDLFEEIREHIPDVKIIYKSDEGWYKEHFYLRFIYLFTLFVGIFSKRMKKRFNERIAHGVKNFIILPTRERYSDFKRNYVFEIIWHEYIHLRQHKAHPIWWPLSYTLVAPTVFTFRSRSEKPAYAASMLAQFKTTGEITTAKKEFIARTFSSSLYVWMWPFPKRAKRWVERTAAKIEAGELDKYYITIADV